MEIAEEHNEHFASVMSFERSFSKYAEYKRAKKCQDDRTMHPTTPDGGTMAAITMLSFCFTAQFRVCKERKKGGERSWVGRQG
jgi:hypothetical protein